MRVRGYGGVRVRGYGVCGADKCSALPQYSGRRKPWKIALNSEQVSAVRSDLLFVGVLCTVALHSQML